jgi:phage terminase large subunit-like protein
VVVRVTEFEQYFSGIGDGRIIACEKMKRIADTLMEKYLNPGEFHFDMEIANRHIEFIERFCKLPTGKLGQPLRLELFQKARLQSIFGFVDDNNLRQYNEVLIIEGRKNGKTTETAAIELDMLMNDKEGAPQIYNVATMLDQARLGFNAANKMRMQSPLLKKHIRKRAADLYCAMNMGFIKALASNTNSLDGLDTHCGVIDELAAIKNRDIYDLVKQSMGAREQPLLFCITTNGFVREGIFDSQYQYASDVLFDRARNNRFLPFIYELDHIDEWDREECWIKANPGLGTVKSIDYLRQMVQKAKDDESFKPTVLVKDFNLKQTSEAAWLRFEDFENTATFTGPFRYGIGGMDAADSVDLAAAKVLCMRRDDPNIYVRQMYWMPQAVLDRQEETGNRRERDNVPYQLWKDKGLLRTVPGNKVDKKVMLDWFCELRDQEDIYILYIGYDPWHIDDSLLREFQSEFGEKAMIPVRQGVITLSQPMKDLKADLQAKLIVYNDHPIDKWCFFNTVVKTDVNGNIQPVKGMDTRNRIDGTLALIDGYKVLQDKMGELQSLI